MQVTPQNDQYLHKLLPIDADEKIIGVYRHHWFAYMTSWVVGVLTALLIMGVAIALVMFGNNDSTIANYKGPILAGAAVLATVVVAGSFVPVYLRTQEQLVLTEEALVQVLQPSLFANKIDQLGLQHISDVSVTQDFFGSIFGYGTVHLETPGEQDNFDFVIVPTPHEMAREISQAHENYNAALMGGRMPTTLGNGNWQSKNTQNMQIDPEQYQQFLQFQQMMAEQQKQSGKDQ